ncbi:MAG: DUF4235 domain-containing protein [Nocardioides sp.]
MAQDSKLSPIIAGLAAMAAAKVSMTILDKGWTAATGKKPPQNPADPEVDVWEAVAWAAATGAAVGLARMLAQRKAKSYFAKAAPQVAASADGAA